jgi:ADP-ribose pyrophosphatase YjhB (NUDIX family)
MNEPAWLTWTRELQALAQTGLAFSRDPYDRERYQALRAIAIDMLATHTGTRGERIAALFESETGYATPKIEVRAAVFDADRRVLMVRERLDHDRWTLPGGWADVNLTPAQNVLKEVREESGYEARILKLAAVWDRTRQGHPPSVWACAKLFFVCELAGGEPRPSLETSEVAWFGRRELPDDLSVGRVLPTQIARMFEHLEQPGLPTDYD